MLVVNATTNAFLGGYEFEYPENTDTFTIRGEYEQPSDFGHIRLFYNELDTMLFYGTIIRMGTGKIIFPAELIPPAQFEVVSTEDLILPKNGFETVFEYSYNDEVYVTAWKSIQNLKKAREYLHSNSEQTVKICWYRPAFCLFWPCEDAYWVMFLKN